MITSRAEAMSLTASQGITLRFRTGINPGPVAQLRAVNYLVNAARELVRKGDAGRALFDLDVTVEKIITSRSLRELKTAKILLNEAERIFTGMDDPELVNWGCRIAAYNYLLGQGEKADKIFLCVSGMIERIDDPSFRDEERHDLVMIYLHINRTADAVKTAKMVEDVVSRSYAYQLIADNLIATRNLLSAKEILIYGCYPAAAAIAGIEIFPGKFDYTVRASHLMTIVKKLNEIWETGEAEKILSEIRNLNGSFFVIPDFL